MIERLRTWAREHRIALAAGGGLFVCAALAFWRLRRAAGYWTIDDAGITYGAAFELADHHSLAPSLEGTPIEGYSNPLLFFIVALLRLVGLFDPVTTHVRLEMLVFAAMVTLVWSLLRAFVHEAAALAGAMLFALVELVTPATWTWYGSGLENVWVAAGLVLMVWLVARTQRGVPLHRGWGVAVFLVAITRPESPVYVAAFYGALVAFARPPAVAFREHVRRLIPVVAVTATLFLVFLAWRRLAYSSWLPNTYYAKLHDKHHLGANLRNYIIGGLFPYANAGLFASCVIGLLLLRKTEKLALALLVFVAASLALPLVAGNDWMGEHRFGTPFFAMSHLAWAVLVAVCLAELIAVRPSAWRPAQVVVLGAALSIAGLLHWQHIAVQDKVVLNEVTIPHVAQLEGALRWEQQMRLGVPNPVVQMPDAGGTELIGGMQQEDNGYLTDFQMARIGRKYLPGHRDLRVLDEYQHEERRPDLVSEHKMFALDQSYLGTRYLPPTGGALWVNRSLVELDAVPPDSKLLYEDAEVRVYLSSDTVTTAGPDGLVRCELVVEWIDGACSPPVQVRATVAHGDGDEIDLVPYSSAAHAIEKHAVLLGAPRAPGTYSVALEFQRGDDRVVVPVFTLDVIARGGDLKPAIAEALSATTPERAALRLAWLREQRLARLWPTAFQRRVRRLAKADESRSATAGADILLFRYNARFAELEAVPAALRAAELVAIRGLAASCNGKQGAERVACLGRVVDRLRRLGYFEVLHRVPEIAREMSAARAHLDTWSDRERYEALVGLLLADPSDISLQWRLLKLRRSLAVVPGSFPTLP